MQPKKFIIAHMHDGTTVTKEFGEGHHDIMSLPMETAHRADLIVMVDVITGTSKVLKNRWGPNTDDKKSADATRKFNGWGELSKTKGFDGRPIENWPAFGIGGSTAFHLIQDQQAERVSIRTGDKPGWPPYVQRHLVPTSRGTLSLAPLAYRAVMDAVHRGIKNPEELKHKKIHLYTVGSGMERRYVAELIDAPMEGLEPRNQYHARPPLPEGSNLYFSPGMLPPPSKNVILDNLLPPAYDKVPATESKAAICTCSIKDLTSTGHVAGCPEKRR